MSIGTNDHARFDDVRIALLVALHLPASVVPEPVRGPLTRQLLDLRGKAFDQRTRPYSLLACGYLHELGAVMAARCAAHRQVEDRQVAGSRNRLRSHEERGV